MEEILRTTDPVLMSFATALLSGADIEFAVFDVHMSIVEGSIGVLPQRLMVVAAHRRRAEAILRDNDVALEG